MGAQDPAAERIIVARARAFSHLRVDSSNVGIRKEKPKAKSTQNFPLIAFIVWLCGSFQFLLVMLQTVSKFLS